MKPVISSLRNAALIGAAALCLSAQAETPSPIAIGLILDGQYKHQPTALAAGDEGFSLGHTELNVNGAIDDRFQGNLTAVIEDHDGETEVALEEAWIETTSLPFHSQLRAGRFLSQIGYLNSRHLHEDDYPERPVIYRALLGGHYFDDGIRLEVLMPTPFYWRIGAEAFKGTAFAGESNASDRAIGTYSLGTKVGGDLGTEHSWQAGTAWLKNRLAGNVTAGHDHDEDEHDHHGHTHGILYSGANLYISDLAWKWAPDGNPRRKQLILTGEHLYADDLNRYATGRHYHEGWYLSAVYRIDGRWTGGLRYGEADLEEAHGDHFHTQFVKESNLMVGWTPSHFASLRLMYTRQQVQGFDDTDDSITLQYVMSLGAHGSHRF